jgi:hypothetical protein
VSCRGIESAKGPQAGEQLNHGENVPIFKENLMIAKELVVSPLNRNGVCSEHQQILNES